MKRYLLAILFVLFVVKIGYCDINVINYGANGSDDYDDTIAIQEALNDAEGSTCFIPDGFYYITLDTLEIKSNTTLRGESRNAVLIGTYDIPIHDEYEDSCGGQIHIILANDNMIGGNSNIVVENLSFDFSAATNGASVCVHFRNCSDYTIRNCRTQGGGDGLSQTYASNYRIENNDCFYHFNAAIDQWGNSRNGKLISNNIYGNGVNTTYGILVTGADTDYQPSGLVTSQITLSNNRIYNVVGAGIWFQGGGRDNANYCRNCKLIGNTIDGVVGYHGVKLTSGGGHILQANIIRNINRKGISFATEHAGDVPAPQKCIISSNILTNISKGFPNVYSGIVLGDVYDTSGGHIITSNSIVGNTHKQGIEGVGTSINTSIIGLNRIE